MCLISSYFHCLIPRFKGSHQELSKYIKSFQKNLRQRKVLVSLPYSYSQFNVIHFIYVVNYFPLNVIILIATKNYEFHFVFLFFQYFCKFSYLPEDYTTYWCLYNHLLYMDFLSFNRQPWNCCLKDTGSFFNIVRAWLQIHICIHYIKIIARNINPQKGHNLKRGIRFSLRNCLTILHDDISV